VVGGAAVRALADEADRVGRVRRPREVIKVRVAAVGFAALAKTPAQVNKVNEVAGGDLAGDVDEGCLAAKAA
jgi:hypothetical protein